MARRLRSAVAVLVAGIASIANARAARFPGYGRSHVFMLATQGRALSLPLRTPGALLLTPTRPDALLHALRAMAAAPARR